MNDPFAPANSESVWKDSKKENVVSEIKHPFSVKITLKAASGYEAEWLNPWVSAETADQLALNVLDLFAAFKKHGVIEAAASAADFTRGQYKGAAGASSPPVQQSAPPVSGDSKQCNHGEMTYRSGEKNGKPWGGWFCPQPKDATDKCNVIWKKF